MCVVGGAHETGTSALQYPTQQEQEAVQRQGRSRPPAGPPPQPDSSGAAPGAGGAKGLSSVLKGGKGQGGGASSSAGGAASMRSVPASPQPGRNKIWYPVMEVILYRGCQMSLRSSAIASNQKFMKQEK